MNAIAASDKVALVFGGGRGMGLAVARRLGSDHRSIVVADKYGELATESAQALVSMGVRAESVACDVFDPVSVEAAVEFAASHGPLVSAVNTAGLSGALASWQPILEVNAVGAANVIAAVAPHMSVGGALVCFASIAATMDPIDEAWKEIVRGAAPAELVDRLAPYVRASEDPALQAYKISKWATAYWCEKHASTFGHRGARLICVSPGLILDTPMGRQERAIRPRMASLIEMTPLGQIRADDVASVVAFLCSPDAFGISGIDIRVDGGLVAAVRSARLGRQTDE